MAFLAIERQAVGVFGDGDLREQRFGRQAGLYDVLRRRRLQDRRRLLEGVFRSNGHDEPEPGAHDVEPETLVLTDLDPLLVLEAWRNGGFENFLDPLQMGGKARLGGNLVTGTSNPNHLPPKSLGPIDAGSEKHRGNIARPPLAA